MCCDITGTALMIRVGADSREQAMREPHVRDALWEAFVVAMLAIGPAVERRSRYGDKPALWTASREIAHLEAPGVIDVRITRAG